MERILEQAGTRGMSVLELHTKSKIAGVGTTRFQDLSETRIKLEKAGRIIKVDDFTRVAASCLLPTAPKPSTTPGLART